MTNSCPTFSRTLIFATRPGIQASGAGAALAVEPDEPGERGEPDRADDDPSSQPAVSATGNVTASAAANASGRVERT
ncbi:hypothetical protein GCM10022254_44440 [Actinomadura meridiana]|uniref:Uncharacterized protein n=1 Tax=Actinomadura meridiana TaxID=559626 RepID=A0ABP8C9B4_9ACTN